MRWREDPDDGDENRSLAPRLSVAAIELERTLGARSHVSRVKPVVVPPVLSATDVKALTSAVGDWAASGR